jgi:signal transduction histidine kinase
LLSVGKRKPGEPRIVGVNGIVSDVLRLLRRTLGSRIIVSATLSPEPLNMRIDPSQLEQVIMNLAINARDAMPAGGTLSLTTALMHVPAGFHATCEPGEYIRVSVVDTGVGMEAAVRERIFEPFFTTKPPEKGTGLGLSTVYRIVQQQGGFLNVDSAPGRGTRVDVYFRSLEPAEGIG